MYIFEYLYKCKNYLFSDIFSNWNMSKYHSFTLSNNSLTLGGAVANVGKEDGVGG